MYFYNPRRPQYIFHPWLLLFCNFLYFNSMFRGKRVSNDKQYYFILFVILFSMIRYNHFNLLFVHTLDSKWKKSNVLQHETLGLILLFSSPQLGESVLFLCSSAANQMTGASLIIDGGWTANWYIYIYTIDTTTHWGTYAYSWFFSPTFDYYIQEDANVAHISWLL